MMSKLTNKKQGSIFENYVESLYQSLGFRTIRNSIICGQEVDIIAEKYIDGVGNVKIFIECKYLIKGNLSNQEVQNYASFLNSLSFKEIGLTKGVIVTNNGFSPQSKMVGKGLLNLVVVSELEREILDLQNPYVLLKREYERRDIYTGFIPLSGKLSKEKLEGYLDVIVKGNVEMYRRKKQSVRHYDPIHDLEGRIVEQLIQHKWTGWQMISILGDYGTGKTTLMQRVFYRLICKYLNKEIIERPIYVELKNYFKFKDLDLFLLQEVRKLFSKDISIDLLRKEMQNGSFIFLLDGFDEMSPQISEKIRMQNFHVLFPLLTSSPSIITCRPSYFVSSKEYKTYLDDVNKSFKSKLDRSSSAKPSVQNERKKMEETYAKLFEHYFPKALDSDTIKESVTIYIDTLSVDQIDNFLKGYDGQFKSKCKSSWLDIKQFLEGIYDLSELMTKPLLLTIIKDTILMLGEHYNENNTIQSGPSAIYEVYTNLNLDFDWKKGETRVFLTKEQRRSFAEAISIAMFDKGVLEVQYDDLLKVVDENRQLLGNLHQELAGVELENIVSDVQICSFITRSDEDKFKFVHKSFMEFFVARVVKSLLVTNIKNDRFEKVPFPKEILYFLGSFCQHEPTLKSRLFQSLNTGRSEIFRRNVATAYLYSSSKHEKLSLRKVVLYEINLFKTLFENSGFTKVEFIKNDWKTLSFTRCDFSDVSIFESKLSYVSIIDSYCELFFSYCELDQFKIDSTKNSQVSLDLCSVKNSEFSNTHITFTSTMQQDCSFFNTTLVFLTAFNCQNLHFRESDINYNEAVFLESCKLENVRFAEKLGVRLKISKSHLLACTFDGNEVEIDRLDSLKSCKGLIFINMDNQEIRRNAVKFSSRGIVQLHELVIFNLHKYRYHEIWVKKIILRSVKSRT